MVIENQKKRKLEKANQTNGTKDEKSTDTTGAKKKIRSKSKKVAAMWAKILDTRQQKNDQRRDMLQKNTLQKSGQITTKDSSLKKNTSTSKSDERKCSKNRFLSTVLQKKRRMKFT